MLAGDAVLRWNDVALDVQVADHAVGVSSQQAGPTRSSRALAIVHAAIYDAAANVDGHLKPFLVHAPNSSASLDSAIAQAAHDVLVSLYSFQSTAIDQALVADLAAIPSSAAKDAGINLGRQIAAQTLATRLLDGSEVDAPGMPKTFVPSTLPGRWRPDPLHPTQTALTPNWGAVKPFVITTGDQFRIAPPPALDSAEYLAAFNEIKELGVSNFVHPTTRTADQTEIGIYWAYDGQPGLGAPSRLYNQITATIAQQQQTSVIENARLFFLVNVAMADAGIAAWESKYLYDFWRPVTAIREADTDNNPATTADPMWAPLGAPADNLGGTNFTPPFPSYASGHATLGAAAFRTLANFFGRDDISFTFVSDEFNGVTKDQFDHVRPFKPRSFSSFSAASEENALSRLYLGVHWRFDATAGMTQGTQVADWIFAHVGEVIQTDDEQFIDRVYHDLLGRSADPAGLAGWAGLIKSGAARFDVITAIENSGERRSSVIESAYQQFLGRAADPTGLAAFSAFLANGGSQEQMIALIIGSDEYFTLHGGTTDGFLAGVYRDLLHRDIDPTGAANHAAALANGVSRAAIAAAILHSPESIGLRIDDLYQTLLQRDPDSSGLQAFSGLLSQGVTFDLVFALAMASDEYFQRH